MILVKLIGLESKLILSYYFFFFLTHYLDLVPQIVFVKLK